MAALFAGREDPWLTLDVRIVSFGFSSSYATRAKKLLAPMSSYHELSRRELQTRCKEYGLPANKSNAVMASSLTSFLGDPRTNVLARAPQGLTAAKKSIKAKLMPKTERLETSLAALILEATESRPNILKAKPKEMFSEGRKLPVSNDWSAFIVSSPAKHVESIPLPKTAPLLRRKNNGATHSTVPANEEISTQTNGTVVKKLSATEPQVAPALDASVLDTSNDSGHNELEALASPSETVLRDQGCQNKSKRCCEENVQPSLGPLFRITANVDKLILRATTMLRKFDEWKGIDKLSAALEAH